MRAAGPAGAAMLPERERSLKQIAVIVNYIKRRYVEGTWLESRFRWQIRTFWFSLLWPGVGLATVVVLVGFFVLMALALWLLYRSVRGWVALEDDRPMYQESRLSS